MTAGFNPPAPQALAALKDIVGDNGWKAGADMERYFEDPRGRFTGLATLVLMPDSVEMVSRIVRYCAGAKIGIIPYGGGTGVVAGQLSPDSADAVIVSLERMNKVREVSVEDGVLVAEAGCILQDIHDCAAREKMIFPLSMASKGSCCIGGNLATNAGGIQVLRHGNARDLCLGVEAVLPDGSILHELSPLRKNNTGYDLRHLLIGSEGTLGIITAASLILKPQDPESVTVFCAIRDHSDGVTLYKNLRAALGESLSAFELMSGFGVDLVRSHFPKLPAPFAQKHPWHLLLQFDGPTGLADTVEQVLGKMFEDNLLIDAVIAQSETQSEDLWALRENTPEANRMAGAFCSSDTSVPIRKIGVFVNETNAALRDIHAGLRINTYGHIGDGNIHHNVFAPEGTPKAEFIQSHPDIIDAVRMAINEVTHRNGGSISAEHGIGRLKTADLEVYASTAKQAALRSIKAALDPDNIMNPGTLLR
ncbi:FAD-binding oxidoreductase [Neptunicoccus cionae]|uniref:D-2-hydroxyacid dehydrogenase n=1 Tax=Neptunicoccus cionae TaxID=2035344 RepID=A0A916VS49_9RHOB|nr:FAD-binding oxidoreductase [Amylibacter cionae]GGA26928.1 D-2-hydroxyacid dehydrogenase [Amylibacter cionae]